MIGKTLALLVTFRKTMTMARCKLVRCKVYISLTRELRLSFLLPEWKEIEWLKTEQQEAGRGSSPVEGRRRSLIKSRSAARCHAKNDIQSADKGHLY